MNQRKPLTRQGIGMLVGLTIQYLLGMTANLFVSFPQGQHDGQLWVFAWHQLPVALHIIIGFLLLINGVFLSVRSIQSKDRRWMNASIIGTLAIITAIIGGSLFIPSQNDTYSFFMAISFLIAFVAFGWGVYTSSVTKSVTHT